MKKIATGMVALLLFTGMSVQVVAQKQMEWTTKSKKAKELALEGSRLMMNIEFPQAYEHFVEAVKLDPNFTVPLFFLSNLTYGETKKQYIDRAVKSAANKSDGEKLLVTLLDEKSTQESRRDIWSKLHDMFPDGGMITNYYVVTRATPEERMKAAKEYVSKFPDNPQMQNMLGYYYMDDMKDNATAKQHFEKYIAMYPKGYNPYDSMGEFYFNTGDMDNAEKYYIKALEIYPFNISSVQKLEEIKKVKEAKAKN